jgi:hypothetical protein
MAGLDPAIPIIRHRPCPAIGIAGSSPAMTTLSGRPPFAVILAMISPGIVRQVFAEP